MEEPTSNLEKQELLTPDLHVTFTDDNVLHEDDEVYNDEQPRDSLHVQKEKMSKKEKKKKKKLVAGLSTPTTMPEDEGDLNRGVNTTVDEQPQFTQSSYYDTQSVAQAHKESKQSKRDAKKFKKLAKKQEIGLDDAKQEELEELRKKEKAEKKRRAIEKNYLKQLKKYEKMRGIVSDTETKLETPTIVTSSGAISGATSGATSRVISGIEGLVSASVPEVLSPEVPITTPNIISKPTPPTTTLVPATTIVPITSTIPVSETDNDTETDGLSDENEAGLDQTLFADEADDDTKEKKEKKDKKNKKGKKGKKGKKSKKGKNSDKKGKGGKKSKKTDEFSNNLLPNQINITYGGTKAEKNERYERQLQKLLIELVKLQAWVQKQKLRVVVIFEGRDAAGKGGVIKRIVERLNPRVCRVVALGTPTEKEKTQWYFQRYVSQLPAAGEIVLFDRSWYNRGGVERVMSFCTEDEYNEFLYSCPIFEELLSRSGILLIKYWFSVSDEVQEARFQERINNSTKRWKLSPMDVESRNRWVEYSKAKDEMLKHTDTDLCPWVHVHADSKKLARLNCISHLLSCIPYQDLTPPAMILPPRKHCQDYVRPPMSAMKWVPDKYA